MIHKITVDLRRPPEERWQLTPEQQRQASELLALYKADLGLPEDVGEFLTGCARELVRADHWAELGALSRMLGVPMSDMVLCNFYYDALKVVVGCTAFAVDSAAGVLHARNLDWWTKSAILSRYTMACHFVGGVAGEFTTIGWPGFIGAFSGIAPGRFAITLNAVLSLEPSVPATPVVLVLRSVLEEAQDFDEALSILSAVPLPSDSLLLLTGTRPSEHAAIERTPSRYAVRRGHHGFTCVTNDYRQIQVHTDQPRSEILATSCHRFNRIESLLSEETPRTPEACFHYLNDAAVKMQITVQQMVFQPATGQYWVRLPVVA
jgi:acid ceramidase